MTKSPEFSFALFSFYYIFMDNQMSIVFLYFSQVVILAAKSVAVFMKFPLPSLEANAKTLASTLFKLLKNYARVGAGTGDNYELVLSSFKVLNLIKT